MTYRPRARGLMGLGMVDDSLPISVGSGASTDPILSAASLAASNVLLRMAGVPKTQRVAEMVSVLNRATPGLGTSARAEYDRLVRGKTPAERDQVMFDVVRGAIAGQLVRLTREQMARQGMSGLGDTMSDVRQGFCMFGAGGVAMTGGFLDQFGAGGKGGTSGSVTGAAQVGANIAGCGIETMQAQAALAESQARVAQSATAQQYAQQAAREDRMFRYALIGGGGLLTLAVVAAILRK